MYFSLKDIRDICLARLEPRVGEDVLSQSICTFYTDTRSIRNTENSIFICIKTPKRDGHDFIDRAYSSGVRFFLVSDPNKIADYQDAVFLLVKDTVEAFQKIASSYRQNFKGEVVAICGSNGKTIIKEWLYQCLSVLEPSKTIYRSPRSYNSQIGVPISVLLMDQNADIAIFEAGISKKGEMQKLASILEPNIGILSNIASAHEQNFKSIEEKLREKLQIFSSCREIIYSANQDIVRQEIESNKVLSNKNAHTWAEEAAHAAAHAAENTAQPVPALQVHSIHQSKTHSQISATYKKEQIEIDIPFSDRASIENLLIIYLYLRARKHSHSNIMACFKELKPLEMRMEMREGLHNNFIIDDSYSCDLDSLQIALDSLKNLKFAPKKRLIISDIQQTQSKDKTYQDLASLLENYKIDSLVGIGEDISQRQNLFKNIAQTEFYGSTRDFLDHSEYYRYQGESILVKGARKFGFEQIVDVLQKRVHQSLMEVNLTALSNNINFFRSKLKPQTKLMLMGKASFYGSGSYEIASVLASSKVDYIAVAYTDEGVELRQKGIDIPILVLNPEESGFHNIIKYDLEPEIYSFRMLNLFCEHIKRYGIKTSYIHIKLDTGMHRLGFMQKDLPELEAKLREIYEVYDIRVASIFSHLATADMPDSNQYTQAQFDRFQEMTQSIKNSLSYGSNILLHILNTAGILRFPQYQMDMVRLGIGLYGIDVCEESKGQLEIVNTLKTRISQIKRIKKGEAVGYARDFVADRDMNLGIIGLGYADGIDRGLGAGVGEVYLKGKKLPIIGKVCMDMCMIDLLDVDAEEGDEVEIFGKNIHISLLAQKLKTIPYEILSTISKRVKRVYYQE